MDKLVRNIYYAATNYHGDKWGKSYQNEKTIGRTWLKTKTANDLNFEKIMFYSQETLLFMPVI